MEGYKISYNVDGEDFIVAGEASRNLKKVLSSIQYPSTVRGERFLIVRIQVRNSFINKGQSLNGAYCDLVFNFWGIFVPPISLNSNLAKLYIHFNYPS